MNKESLSGRVLKFIAQQETIGVLPKGGGIAIAVLKDGDVIFSEAYGLRDRERDLPVTSETVFETCSLTKGFTSAAWMMAMEEKKIDLKQPIKYIKKNAHIERFGNNRKGFDPRCPFSSNRAPSLRSGLVLGILRSKGILAGSGKSSSGS